MLRLGKRVVLSQSPWSHTACPRLAPAVPGRTPRTRQDLDADLQRAIELSLAESQPSGSKYIGSEPPLRPKAGTLEDDDEEMRLAIEASLREMERERPTAPEGNEEPDFKVSFSLDRMILGSFISALTDV